jgi:hypothetical protein
MRGIAQLAGIALLRRASIKLRKMPHQDLLELLFAFGPWQNKFQGCSANYSRPQDDNLVFLGKPADILARDGQGIAYRFRHLDAKRQMNAALEIQPKIDSACR